jgi:hypothetical protein
VQCFYSDRVTLLFGRRERSCALLGADVIAETASQTYHCSPPATAPAGSGATYVMIMMRVCIAIHSVLACRCRVLARLLLHIPCVPLSCLLLLSSLIMRAPCFACDRGQAGAPQTQCPQHGGTNCGWSYQAHDAIPNTFT